MLNHFKLISLFLFLLFIFIGLTNCSSNDNSELKNKLVSFEKKITEEQNVNQTLKEKLINYEKTISELQQENKSLKETPSSRFQQAIDLMNDHSKENYRKTIALLEKVIVQTDNPGLEEKAEKKLKECKTKIEEFDFVQEYDEISKSSTTYLEKIEALEKLKDKSDKPLSFSKEINNSIIELKKEYDKEAKGKLDGILKLLDSDEKSDFQTALSSLEDFEKEYKKSNLIGTVKRKIVEVKRKIKNFDKEMVKKYKKDCKTYKYNVLKRDAEDLSGKKIALRGKVFNVQKSGDMQLIQLNVTRRYFWTDQVFVLFDGKTQVYNNDVVRVYGTIEGEYTYTSQANYQITVPKVSAKYIVK